MNVLIAGDFCPLNRVADIFTQGDFKSVLGDIKCIISAVDYSIVNFECPVTKGKVKPIDKSGPNHRCSEEGIDAVRWAGFNCVTLANNHFLDYGKDGVENTLEACKKYGIDTVGGGKNLHEASKILYKEVDGKTLALINCCEHEFSIATEDTAGSNPLNPIQQYYAIKEAKEKANYVLVIVHGGHEHHQLPSPRMQETYRFFIDSGADAVVNGHQHCYSGYEIYNGRPIFYGLGNLCFDYPHIFNKPWNEGYMIELTLESNSDIKFKLIPYFQCNKEPRIQLLQDDRIFRNKISTLNEIISSPTKLENKLNNFYLTRKERSLDVYQPYFGNKMLYWLYRHHFLPKMISKKQLLKIYNILECESHRDKYIAIFKDKFNIK